MGLHDPVGRTGISVRIGEARVEARAPGRPRPLVDVDAGNPAAYARQPEHELRRLGRTPRAEWPVREVHDAAGLGEPDLTTHRLEHLARMSRRVVVRVLVVVEAPDS